MRGQIRARLLWVKDNAMGGILPDADLGGEVVGTAVRIGPNTRMDSDVFMALYAPNADISPADGQSISFQAGARRSLQRPRRLAAQEGPGRPRLDSQPGTEEGEITEKKTIAMRRSEALPNRNELAVN